jgi:hypothetical protein
MTRSTKTALVIVLLTFACYGASCQKVADQIDDVGTKAGEVINQLPENPQLEDVAVAVAPLIPGGAGALQLGAFALLLIRNWQNRNAGRKIAEAINSASSGGQINFKDEATRNELSRVMGSSGKRLVDEAQGKARSLPI